MLLLIFYFTFAITISLLCSLAESAFLSITKTHIGLQVKENKKVGHILAKLKENTDQSLTSILTLNTFANTLGAVAVGAQAEKLYGDMFVTISSVVLTLCILFFSEIIPKTLGTIYWKKLTAYSAYFIFFLSFIFSPLTRMLRFFKSLKHKESVDRLRQEVIVSAEQGETEGYLKSKESKIIKNLIALDHKKVEDIMTPRTVIKAYSSDLTVKEAFKQEAIIRFSRLPVYEDSLDNVVGLLHRFKLLEKMAKDKHNLPIKELMIPVHRVGTDLSVSAVLNEFIQRKEHLFIVSDDYGATLGLVTLEDAIETLLGEEIVDEYDSVVDMRKLAKEEFLKRKLNNGRKK